MLAGGDRQENSRLLREDAAQNGAILAQRSAGGSGELKKSTAETTTVKPSSRVEVKDDPATIGLLGIILALLTAAFIAGRILRAQPETTINPLVVRIFNQRIRAWWMMCAILVAGILVGHVATVVLFGLVSFMALREFITVTPTRRGDHRSIFWAFFLLTPAQYVLVGLGQKYYGLYSILIPVYASLFIPARSAFSGDHKRFLERSAKIQAGLLICVYSLSYAPALLSLELGNWEMTENGRQFVHFTGSNAGLLFYFVLITQLGDVFQFAWGKLAGRHVIAPAISSSRTWEGLVGGMLTSTLAGAIFYWATPFSLWQSACMSLIISLMGFAGGMTMSAIKRDRGVKDYGTLVTGHAGVLDRIDSLCFAAPIFFHLTRFYFTQT
jgi:phosphatidate cytidylyltransferase